MNSRDTILQRIRDGLADRPVCELPPVPEVWPSTNPSAGKLTERFTTELEAVTGEVVHCKSMDEAKAKLTELADAEAWETIAAVERPLCHELLDAMPASRVTWAKDGWAPKEMADVPVGIVAAEQLIADTGSCLVCNNTAEERLMCFLPPTSVVVAKVGQLVEHLPAAWESIAWQTAEADRRGEFLLITGPSRTADIEKILILGVHGPKRLIVLLVDES